MSDSAEKPFDPTPRRVARAKREGNVARSSELAANCAFAAAAACISGVMPSVAAIAAGTIARSIAHPVVEPAAVALIAAACLPIGCAALAGSCAHVLQSGGAGPVAVTAKLERLNPLEGLRRICSRETLAHSLRAGLAFGCVVAGTLPAIAWALAISVRAGHVAEIATAAWHAAQEVVCVAAGVGSIFSIGEYGAARAAWLRKLRMSFEERKREVKEDEGDANARGRRRALHRSLVRAGVSRVREAAFVIVNPTHVAVALAYAPPRIAVPAVLVRAAGETARRVRDVARLHGVPVVEDARLARALYRDARSGEKIPHAHYVAVAEVVIALVRASRLRA